MGNITCAILYCEINSLVLRLIVYVLQDHFGSIQLVMNWLRISTVSKSIRLLNPFGMILIGNFRIYIYISAAFMAAERYAALAPEVRELPPRTRGRREFCFIHTFHFLK